MPQLDFFKSIDEILLAFSALIFIYALIILFIIPIQIENLGIKLMLIIQNDIKKYTIECFFLTSNNSSNNNQFNYHILI